MNHTEERYKLRSALITLFFTILFGTYFYRLIEEWTWINALYFTVATVTTVGYGDITPTHTVSKIFTVFFMLASIGLALYSLNILASIRFQNRSKTFFFRDSIEKAIIRHKRKFFKHKKQSESNTGSRASLSR